MSSNGLYVSGWIHTPDTAWVTVETLIILFVYKIARLNNVYLTIISSTEKSTEPVVEISLALQEEHTGLENVGIIDGIPVVPHSMPYMAAIRTTKNDKSVLCGGALISDRLILTAAKCLYGSKVAEVILGAHNIQEKEDSQVSISATTFYIHEKYTPDSVYHDIAIIELPDAVSMNENISPIELPKMTDILNSYTEQEAIVAGWGKTNDTNPAFSDELRYQKFTIIPTLICEITNLLKIQPTQICTSGASTRNICLGDAGSPLVLNGVLIGIASYGSSWGCGIGAPGVFTRMTSYLGWMMVGPP